MANWVEIGAVAGISSIGLTIFGWIGRGIWRIGVTFEGMRHSLHQIASNDLPHIYEELKSLREGQQRGKNSLSIGRRNR